MPRKSKKTERRNVVNMDCAGIDLAKPRALEVRDSAPSGDTDTPGAEPVSGEAVSGELRA